jgi:hypothetical protein
LAQVLEMQGKVEEAQKAYDRVKGDLSALADERAEQLATPEVQAASAWLASAELPKRETPSTSGAALGTRPNCDADVPAPAPSKPPALDDRTLEEILGGESKEAVDSNRYDGAAETDVDANEETPATDSAPTEVPVATESADQEETPANDAAGP